MLLPIPMKEMLEAVVSRPTAKAQLAEADLAPQLRAALRLSCRCFEIAPNFSHHSFIWFVQSEGQASRATVRLAADFMVETSAMARNFALFLQARTGTNRAITIRA